MKLHTRLVAVGAVAALALATPATAHAAGKPGKPVKAKPAAAEKGQAKALGGQLDRAKGARKAAEARARFTLPGAVTSVDPATSTVTIMRKERGVVVSRSLVVDPAAQVKRDGVVVTLADVQVGDHVVAHGRRVDGTLVVFRLTAETPFTEPVSDTATATIAIG